MEAAKCTIKIAIHGEYVQVASYTDGWAWYRKNRIPDYIRQNENESNKKMEAAKGTIKIAIHEDDTLTVLIYDNKPVHYLSTTDCNLTSVLAKAYTVWDTEKGCISAIEVWKLNVTIAYNTNMNTVDRADKLICQYRIDHCWWRNKKWWRSVYILLIVVAQTNSYLMYVRTCAREGVTSKSHFDFIRDLSQQLMETTRVVKNVNSLTHQ